MICADSEGKALPVFIDFGAARPSTVDTGQSVTTIATPGYAPIEQQAEDNQPQGPFTDIYALACTSFEALTGIRPDDALKSRILNDKLPAQLDQQSGQLSDPVIDALSWGLKLYSQERPQSLDEWLAAFQGQATQPAGGQRSSNPTQIFEGGSTPAIGDGGAAVAEPKSRPAPHPLNNPPAKSNRTLGLFVGIGVIAAAAAGVVYYNPDLVAVEPDVSEQRVQACDSISLSEQPLPSIRCYRAVLADFPGHSAASQGEVNGLEYLFRQVTELSGQGNYGQALTVLDDLARLDADEARIARMRQEMLADVSQAAEQSIRQRNLEQAKQQVAQLERLGGDAQQVAQLKQQIADIETAERRTLAAFAECRGLREGRRYQAAHSCFDKLAQQYPQAAEEKVGVENDLRTYIDTLLQQGQLDDAERQIKVAADLGMDVALYQERLAKARTREKEEQAERARKAAEAREIELRNNAILADRRRPTYGFELDGQFSDSSRGTVFTVTRVNDALSRLIPIAQGDMIERINGQRLDNVEAVRADLQGRKSYVEDFSGGVPDSRVIDELILRKLDATPGQVKFRIRRNGSPESIFCKNPGSIQCSGS